MSKMAGTKTGRIIYDNFVQVDIAPADKPAEWTKWGSVRECERLVNIALETARGAWTAKEKEAAKDLTAKKVMLLNGQAVLQILQTDNQSRRRFPTIQGWKIEAHTEWNR